mmetsp:Transcript_1980/g.5304  ORF Transcript_1980/g.5304 Transcript_1980/m.5304 type:complete len:248 (-) Transcript_1980:994-1737(-)
MPLRVWPAHGRFRGGRKRGVRRQWVHFFQTRIPKRGPGAARAQAGDHVDGERHERRHRQGHSGAAGLGHGARALWQGQGAYRLCAHVQAAARQADGHSDGAVPEQVLPWPPGVLHRPQSWGRAGDAGVLRRRRALPTHRHQEAVARVVHHVWLPQGGEPRVRVAVRPRGVDALAVHAGFGCDHKDAAVHQLCASRDAGAARLLWESAGGSELRGGAVVARPVPLDGVAWPKLLLPGSEGVVQVLSAL